MSSNTIVTITSAAIAATALLLLASCHDDALGKHARGNWQGTAHQINTDGTEYDYDITVIVHDDEHIAIDYPGLNCNSTLERLPSSDGHAEFVEHMTDPDALDCVDKGLVTLVLSETDNSKMDYRWKIHLHNAQELTFASGTLNRIPPAAPKDIEYFRNQQNR